MKKLTSLLVMAGLVLLAGIARGTPAAPNVTNSVQQVNFTLTFFSQLGPKTSYVTNFTHTGTGANRMKSTNITTNVTYTVSKKSISTKDVITSLLGSNAPAGATLVRLESLGNYFSETYQIRYRDIRVAVTNFELYEGIQWAMVNGSKTKNGAVVPGSGTSYSLTEFDLGLTAGSPLSFSVRGATEITYVPASLGKFSSAVDNLTTEVSGYGSDSLGDYELVTGTITVNGAMLEADVVTP